MLKTIDIVEIFGSISDLIIQGEGDRVGHPAIFIRTFGCNLKCKFGVANDSELAASYEKQIRNYPLDFPNKTLNEMPNFPVFCDTPYSIFSEYKKFVKEYTVDELISELYDRCPSFGNEVDLVITGGEPLLHKNQEFWGEFLKKVGKECNVVNVTFETNATQTLQSLVYWASSTVNVFFSMSPKMACSGHSFKETCKPEVINQLNTFQSRSKSWFKFVVKSEEDIKDISDYIIEISKTYMEVFDIPIYLMPEGSEFNDYMKNAKVVYDLCAKHGYRFSPRLQVMHAENAIGK